MTATKRPALKKIDPRNFVPTPRNPEAHLHSEILRPLGFVDAVPNDERLALLHSLEGDLSPQETDALLAALVSEKLADTSTARFSSYVHEIGLALQKQPDGYDLFARGLATLAGDSKRPAVIRDYALQHLRLLWDHSKEEVELRWAIESSFWELAKPGAPDAASALLSLHELGSY